MDFDDPVLKHFPRKWRPFLVISAGILLQFTYGLVYTFGNFNQNLSNSSEF